MKQKHIVIDARIRRSSTGRYVDRLLEHLQTVDTFHRYTILLQPDDPWKPKAKNFHAVPCPYKQFSFSVLEQLGFARQLYGLKPGLVHFTMTQQPLLYFGKIVTTTHDLTMFRFVRKGATSSAVFALKMGLYRFLLKWSHLKSDKIIAPTLYVADDIAAYQPSVKNKLVVTYESSEPPLKAAAVRPKAIGEHDQFIMYIGNAFPHKNLETLVDAFAMLQIKHSDLKLVLVGKKEIHYEELEQYVATDPPTKHVIITGFLPDEQTKWLYQHCKAYIFPSLSEGFGLPGLEAMAHGAPVVSSDATCLPELYGNAAYYFDPTSTEDMAAKIDDVLASAPLRKKLITASKTQLAKYSWRRMAEETLDVYKEVLGDISKDV